MWGPTAERSPGRQSRTPTIHLIPRRRGDTEYPQGGVRYVIPHKGAPTGRDSTCAYKVDAMQVQTSEQYEYSPIKLWSSLARQLATGRQTKCSLNSAQLKDRDATNSSH